MIYVGFQIALAAFVWSVFFKSLKTRQLQPTMATVFTLADCQKHRDREDCWIIVDGKVCELALILHRARISFLT
jgi:cytochrome b involved in lipid metabolism